MDKIQQEHHLKLMEKSIKKKIAYQELPSTDQYRFIFVPKYKKIYGIKTGIANVFIHLDGDLKTPIPHPTQEGELVIGFNGTPATVELFEKDEYDAMIVNYNKGDAV